MSKRVRGNFNPELIQASLRQGTNNVVQMFGGGTATAGYPLLYDANGNAIASQPRGATTVVQLADSTTNPANGNAASFDANGNIKDAGVAPAQNSAATAHKFLSAYTSATGAFTQAQPADADLAVSDVTANNVSTSAHGFAPKSPGSATVYLDGTGAYSTPPGFANPLTTPGDVIVGGPSGAPARLSVGSNGKVLTANSAATNGVDWETPATATTSAPGIVKPDGTTINVASGVISVPAASSSSLGLVQPDGTIITNTGGAITVAKASSSAFGVVKPDGTTITASGGVLSAVGGGGGGSITFAPPYIVSGGSYYIAQTGQLATRPSSSPPYLNTAPASLTAGVNGDIIVVGPSSGTAYASLTGSASAEIAGQLLTTMAAGAATYSAMGVWLWDSANNLVYEVGVWFSSFTASGQSVNAANFTCQKYTYSGTGTPAYSANITAPPIGWQGMGGGVVNLKIVKSGTTISYQISLNGGANWITIATSGSIGTITKGGWFVSALCTADIFHCAVS